MSTLHRQLYTSIKLQAVCTYIATYLTSMRTKCILGQNKKDFACEIISWASRKDVLTRYIYPLRVWSRTLWCQTPTVWVWNVTLCKDLPHIDDILSSPVWDEVDRGSHENMHATMKELAQLIKATSLPAMHFNTKNYKSEIMGKKRTPYWPSSVSPSFYFS